MFENLTKSMSHIVCLIWKFSRGGWRTAFLPGNTKWHTKCYRLCSSIINAQFKAFWIPILQYNNSLRAPWKRCAKINQNRNLEAKNRESNWTVIITINQEFTLLEVTENMLKIALNLFYVCLQTYCLFFIFFFPQKLIYLFYFFWVSHLIRVWEQQQKWHLLM